jgi:hypothetical protein
MKTARNTFKRSTSCTCRNSAVVCALDTRGSDDAANHELVGVFCKDCAARGIRELAPCSWLHIVSASRRGERTRPSVRRSYKVYSLNERANRADIIIIDSSNQFLCGLRLEVRFDALSPSSRFIEATFQLAGTPLEIELFERSGGKS